MNAIAIIINGLVVTGAASFLIAFCNQFSGWGDGATSAQYVPITSIVAYFLTLLISTFFKKEKTRNNILASAIVLLIIGLSLNDGPLGAAVILFFATILFSIPSLLLAKIGT